MRSISCSTGRWYAFNDVIDWGKGYIPYACPYDSSIACAISNSIINDDHDHHMHEIALAI